MDRFDLHGSETVAEGRERGGGGCHQQCSSTASDLDRQKKRKAVTACHF